MHKLACQPKAPSDVFTQAKAQLWQPCLAAQPAVPCIHHSSACTAPASQLASHHRPPATLQLERKGYFIVDVPFNPEQPQQPMVLFNIPDGRAKNMPGMA